MKKVVSIMMILFSAVIVFFSFFGERLYYLTKPDAVIYRVQSIWTDENGDMKLLIPKECVKESGYVYVVTQTGGFSLTINTVSKKAVDITDSRNDGYVIVNKGLSLGDMLVVEVSEELRDGDRINCIESSG